MSVSAPDDAFLDVNDAHLRVYGNVHADGLKLGQLEVVTTTSTGSTINFLHQHTAFTTTSNIDVGTTNHELFVDTNLSRVGVLTNTPTTALDVNGTVTATAFAGDGANLTGIPSSAINGTLSQWTTVTGPKIHYSDGNVGVGVADPAFKLDVDGDINFTGTLREDGNPFVSTPWTIESGPTALSYTGGNVGIGAGTPSAKLEVTGNAHVSTDLSVGGTLSINTITAAATHALSAVTAVGASTGDTIQLTHATTGLVTTANVEVGKDLTVTGNVTASTFSDGTAQLTGGTWSGSAASLTTAVDIGGVAFDGSASIVPTTFGGATFSGDVTVDTNTLHVDATNNRIGIGTSSPSAKLQIGPLDDDHLYLASANNAYGWKLDTDDQGNGAVPFRIKKRLNGTDQTILNIKNQDGYVGIGGSETPTARLTVFNSITSSDNTIPAANLGENTAFPNTTHLWLAQKHSNYAPYWGLAVGTIWSGKSYLQNLNKRTNTYYDLLLNPNGGRVAIGKTTADSGHILDVNSDEAIHIEMANTLYETTIFGGSIFIRNPSTSSGYEHFIINNHASGSHTTSYIQFRRGTAGNGSAIGTISGNGSTISYGGQSDYRVKENIVPMPISGLDTINNLQPKRFNFIGYPDDIYDGFIAHELQEHIPMAVTGVKDEMRGRGNVVNIDDESIIVKEDVSEPDSLEEGTKWVKLSEEPVYQNVDLSKIVTYLVKAVQELSEENQTLKTRLDALENGS